MTSAPCCACTPLGQKRVWAKLNNTVHIINPYPFLTPIYNNLGPPSLNRGLESLIKNLRQNLGQTHTRIDGHTDTHTAVFIELLHN
jgi:hypothetical protein